MCIRDSPFNGDNTYRALDTMARVLASVSAPQADEVERAKICLLYTSDAADERSSVDLGGRRIIKKKKCPNAIAGRQTMISIQSHIVKKVRQYT